MTEKELWAPMPVKGFEHYKISSFGRVSNKHCRILHPFNRWKNYLAVNLYGKGKNYCVYVAKMVALAFIPNTDPTKTCVSYRDKNPSNVCASNLYWSEPLAINKKQMERSNALQFVPCVVKKSVTKPKAVEKDDFIRFMLDHIESRT